MQTKKKMKQSIIICMLLIIILFIDCGARLDADAQVLFCLSDQSQKLNMNGTADCIMQMDQAIHENAYLLQEQIRSSESLTVRGRVWRSQSSIRFDYLIGICILELLLALSDQKIRKIHIYDNRYILQRYYHIIYIQDSDGRKKVSMP